MALDAKMISQAEQVSALTDNSLISVSEGEGQPQKNISFPNLVAEIQGEDSKIATASTMEYVRGLDANGNPIMINKSDLASVVAELEVGIRFRGIVSDSMGTSNLNNVTTPGLYYVHDGVENVPNDAWHGSVLLVFKTHQFNYFMQLYISPAYNKIFKRSKVYDGDEWTTWTEL